MTETGMFERDVTDAAPSVSWQGRLALMAFLLGTGVSMVGNTLVLVALPWFVLETTGSAARTGAIAMAGALPALLSGLLGGVVVDRLGGRAMSVIADVISGVAVILIPILYLTIGLNFWVLAALVFVGAALDIPGATARRTLLPELARGANLRDEAISSAHETLQTAAFVVGPVLAGALIALIGTVHLLWITAGGFFLSALCIGLFAPAGKHVAEAGSEHVATSAMAELKAGLRYLRADSLLLWLAIGLTLMNFLNAPFWGVVLPVLVEDRFGHAAQLGLLFTAFGAGSLLGGLAYGAVGHRFRARRRVIYLVGMTSFCVLVWAFVPAIPFPVMLALVFAEGLVTGPVNPLLLAVRLERIPEALRGRVFATFSGLAAAAMPIGMLAAGWLFETAGVEGGMTAVAIVTTGAVGVLWLVRPLHEMDVQEDAEGTG
jgi:MFS family permease